MLKYITVKNFLSFKEETEINFESNLYGKLKENVFSQGGKQSKKSVLMKNMLIYGANASGKSNIIKAVKFIKSFALSSKDADFFTGINLPFLFDSVSNEESTFFELWFFLNNQEFIYNFELFEENVLKENLIKVEYKNKERRENNLFTRIKWEIISGKWFEKELEKWKDKVRNNTSVISVLSEWNGKLEWEDIWNIFRKIHVLDLHSSAELFSWKMIKKSVTCKDFFVKFLQFADIWVLDIKFSKETLPEWLLKMINESTVTKGDKEAMKKDFETKIQFWHKVAGNNELEYMDIRNESDWTQKLFSILWPIIDTIFNEEILFIDEIESNLHLHLLQEIIKFINSDIQWKKYQCIFTTHNVSLMDLNLLKPEQIWIVDKKENWISDFYTLYDFDEVRTWRDIQKYFNAGIYWWIPHVWDFSQLLNNLDLWVEEK